MSTKPTDETRRIVAAADTDAPCATGETGSHWSGDSIHHREPRSHPFDRLRNPKTCSNSAAAAPPGCHGWVHAHPARAYRLGYLVHMGKDPATIPVYYRTGGWQQLNKDGTRHPCPPPEDLPTHIDIQERRPMNAPNTTSPSAANPQPAKTRQPNHTCCSGSTPKPPASAAPTRNSWRSA